MNGCARLRLDVIMYNHHHTLTFELRVVTISAPGPLCFTPRWSMFGLTQQFHSILTLSRSHYEYNEWLEKVDIGTWALEWSPQPGFESWLGQSVIGNNVTVNL
eukprot:scaffold172223_cov23-Cyclotella_meneghiniana.AAC.3